MPESMLNDSNGLTNSKLSIATATPADVASGKTFYAGDKTLKSGSYKKTYTTVYLGQNPGYWSNFSYNVKSNYPSLYSSLTRSNFYAVPVKYKGNSTGTSGNEGGLGDNCSYNPSTGIFSGHTTSVGPGGTWAGAVIYNFYMVY